MKSHICGVEGECNDYCGGGQMKNLRAQIAAQAQEIKTLREEREIDRKFLAGDKAIIESMGVQMTAKDRLLAERRRKL